MRMEIWKLFLVVCDRNLIWSEWKYSKAAFWNRNVFIGILYRKKGIYTQNLSFF